MPRPFLFVSAAGPLASPPAGERLPFRPPFLEPVDVVVYPAEDGGR